MRISSKHRLIAGSVTGPLSVRFRRARDAIQLGGRGCQHRDTAGCTMHAQFGRACNQLVRSGRIQARRRQCAQNRGSDGNSHKTSEQENCELRFTDHVTPPRSGPYLALSLSLSRAPTSPTTYSKSTQCLPVTSTPEYWNTRLWSLSVASTSITSHSQNTEVEAPRCRGPLTRPSPQYSRLPLGSTLVCGHDGWWQCTTRPSSYHLSS